jgi:hypothetical protein
MDVDLDIDHYKFKELLGLFKAHQVNETTLVQMEQMVHQVKLGFPKDIYLFYYKAYKLLMFLHGLYRQQIIVLEEGPLLEQYLTKLKRVDSFETYDTDSILEKMIPKSEPVTNVFVNDIAPGTLNTVKRITQYKNLNLNSCFRSNFFQTTSSQFQYSLPGEIINVVSMRLASIEVPNAWYLFTNKNNTFTIRFHGVDGIKEYCIVIPEGNYNDETIQRLLNCYFFYKSDVTNELKHIRFHINPQTFKSSFELLDLPDTTISLVFSEDRSTMMDTCGWILGYRMAQYEPQLRILSEGLFNGNGSCYIYFALNDYQNNNNGVNLVGLNRTMMEQDILAKIPMTNGKLALNINDHNNPLTKTRRYNGPVNIKKMQVTLYDMFGNLLDLNHMDFSFTLEMEILYENFKFKNITR